MQRSALERLPRTTDIFESPVPHGPAAPPVAAPPSGGGDPAAGPATAATDPVPAGYYPPLPIAVDRDDLPAALRTLLWGWSVVARLDDRQVTAAAATPQMHAAAAEVRTRPFEGDARAAVHLLLALEGRPGAYSLEEQRRLVELLDAAGVAPDGETNRLVTGGKPFVPAVRRYAGLPPVLQEMVADERLDLKTAERLREFPSAAAAAGEHTAGLSFSNRRRFFTMLWEVAQRDALGDEELVTVVAEVVRGGATNEAGTAAGSAGRRPTVTPGAASADAARDPLSALRRRRYPTLSGLEARFEEIAGRALSGSGVRLSPPANFEGSRFTVEFTFDSRRELEKRVAALSALEDEVDELSSLL